MLLLPLLPEEGGGRLPGRRSARFEGLGTYGAPLRNNWETISNIAFKNPTPTASCLLWKSAVNAFF